MRNIVDASKLDLKSTIVSIRRVAKTVKGGRNMRFSVTVVVGDGNGYVGVGLGKSQEIPEAVRKAEEDAKKNLIYVPTVGTTVPHKNLGVFGAGRVHAGGTRYRSYRRFFRTYGTGICGYQGRQSEIHRFQQLWKHGLRNTGGPQGHDDCRKGREAQRQDSRRNLRIGGYARTWLK